MSGPPVVWILVRDLSRTGVPIVLERLLAAVPDAAGSVHVVAVHGGPLGARVRRRCGSVTLLEPTGRRSFPDAAAVGLMVLGLDSWGAKVRRTAWARKVRTLPPPDVVVLHGAGSWLARSVVPDDVPTVVHLHELQTGLERSIPEDQQRDALAGAALVMAVSRPVADLAVQRGARAREVEIVPGVVDLASSRPAASPGAALLEARPVMGAGTPGWRKATDRMVALAHELDRLGRPAAVGWVGGVPAAGEASAVASPDPVHWLPELEDPWSVLASTEVIAVPSREDPLPLVALEAGLHRRPVVAMPTGGLPDLLADGRGSVANGHDLRSFCDAVAALLEVPERAAAMGDALHAHVVRHHDSTVVAARWWSALVDVASR